MVSGTNTNKSNKNNKTSIYSEIKVDSGELYFHPCFAIKTNHSLLNKNKHIGRQLENKKFDILMLNHYIIHW